MYLCVKKKGQQTLAFLKSGGEGGIPQSSCCPVSPRRGAWCFVRIPKGFSWPSYRLVPVDNTELVSFSLAKMPLHSIPH